MSAKELEDFISVIESAERISRSIKRLPLPSASSTHSKPSSSGSGSSSFQQRHPNVHVPQLWKPKTGSEFLGSSWGSTAPSLPSSSSASTIASKATPSSSSTSPPTTVKTVKTAAATQTSAASSPVKESPPIKLADAEVPEERDLLFDIQSHGRFGRVIAKDLNPAASPEQSPSAVRRSRRSSSHGSPAKTKTISTDVSSEETKDSSPLKKAPIAQERLSNKPLFRKQERRRGSDESNDAEEDFIEEVVEEVSEVGSPRKMPPKPTSVSIKQQSVKVHVHQKSDASKKITKRRPKSAPPPKIKIRPKPPPAPPKVDLRNYSKSLKLLGFDIPSNRREATKLTHQEVVIRTTSPVVRTRLKERTQSVSDIQDVIDAKHVVEKSEFGKVRESLRRAVFEEWYFRKNNQQEERRRREIEERMEKEYEQEMEKEEKKEKSKEAFKDWLERKNSELKKKEKLAKRLAAKAVKKELFTANEKEEKLKEWKRKKEEELEKMKKQQRLNIKKLEKLEEEKKLKREKAVKEFENWQKQALEKHKEVRRREKEELEAQKQKKVEDELDKAKANEAIFNRWNQDKEEELKRAAETEAEKLERLKRTEELETLRRLELAREAYEGWLTKVEERELEEMLLAEEEEAAIVGKELGLLFRPPWYPGGVAEI